MFINGKTLLNANPIVGMVDQKIRYRGTSWGLSEAGYDIRIKQHVRFINDSYGARTEVTDPDTMDIDPDTGELNLESGHKELFSGHFVLASSMEKFRTPNFLVGNVKDKSTWARRGLSVFNTVIEPGWNGWLTLELVYHGQEELIIYPGQGIAQVLYGVLTEARDYGDGKYQSAANKPQKAITS